jgi:Ribosomal protein S4 and related proteins
MRFVSIRLTKLFYLTFTYRQFRRLAFEMRRKDGYYGHNFCLALEGRLVSAIYRSSLVSNLFQSIQLVKQGYVAVNKVYQKHVNYRVKVSEFITFELLTKRIIYFCLLKRLACRAVVFNPPRYMFVSYSFLFAYMKRPPSRKDLVFPVGIDLYRATGYAY